MGIDDKIVIQYWFFYLYNPGINTHEGDREMIQIICEENGRSFAYERISPEFQTGGEDPERLSDLYFDPFFIYL